MIPIDKEKEKMMSIKEDYEALLNKINQTDVDFHPSQQEKLKLYGLYKQINYGDAQGEKPPMTDFVERAKYAAWEKCQGMTQEEAMKHCVDFLRSKNIKPYD